MYKSCVSCSTSYKLASEETKTICATCDAAYSNWELISFKDYIKTKKGLKLVVTPEQSRHTQQICFDNDLYWYGEIASTDYKHINMPFMYIDRGGIRYDSLISKTDFEEFSYDNISAEWFIKVFGQNTALQEEPLDKRVLGVGDTDRATPTESIKVIGNITRELLNKIDTKANFDEVITHSVKPEFTKYDSEKTNLAILLDCPKALEEVAKVMSAGAKKYARKNWALVDDDERYTAAALRHIFADAQGEKIDKDINTYHLANAITCLLFRLELELQTKD